MITAPVPSQVFRPVLKVLLPLICLLAPASLLAQDRPAKTTPPANSPGDFAQAADEVLHNMSEITGLSLVSPTQKDPPLAGRNPRLRDPSDG
jgi:hypothetical protein